MKDINQVKIFDKTLAQHIALFFVAWFTPVLIANYYPCLGSTFYSFLISLTVYIMLEVLANCIHKKELLKKNK